MPGFRQDARAGRKSGPYRHPRTAARVLIVTFSRDAAAEIRSRLEHRVPHAIARVQAQTFHALTMRHCLASGLFRQFIGPGQQAALLRRVWNHSASTIPWESFRRAVEARVSDLATPPPHPCFDAAFDDYLELLEAHSALDFGQVIARSAQGLRDGTLSPIPCSDLRVDEGRDIEQIQLDWTLAHADRGAVIDLDGQRSPE